MLVRAEWETRSRSCIILRLALSFLSPTPISSKGNSRYFCSSSHGLMVHELQLQEQFIFTQTLMICTPKSIQHRCAGAVSRSSHGNAQCDQSILCRSGSFMPIFVSSPIRLVRGFSLWLNLSLTRKRLLESTTRALHVFSVRASPTAFPPHRPTEICH